MRDTKQSTIKEVDLRDCQLPVAHRNRIFRALDRLEKIRKVNPNYGLKLEKRK